MAQGLTPQVVYV